MHLPSNQFFGQSFEGFGRCCFIDKVKTGLAGFFHNLFNAVYQQCGRGGFVARDVVETDIAEAAFFPIATMRHRELVPTPIAPEAVHGVEHVQQRQIVVQGQAIPSGGAYFFKGHVGL